MYKKPVGEKGGETTYFRIQYMKRDSRLLLVYSSRKMYTERRLISYISVYNSRDE